MVRRRLRRPLVWVAAPVLALVAGIGLYWFQPWKLVTDRTVNEGLVAAPEPQSSGSLPPASESASAPRPAVVRQGRFISHEHHTGGLARVILKPDGARVLELVGLDTSNGPDLRVWLSDQPVRSGTEGWRVFDDGEWLELGRLKGNKGDQTYAIPAGTNLDQLDSAAIWCKRFSVSFGAASLTPIT
jgi:electron transfer DM13